MLACYYCILFIQRTPLGLDAWVALPGGDYLVLPRCEQRGPTQLCCDMHTACMLLALLHASVGCRRGAVAAPFPTAPTTIKPPMHVLPGLARHDPVGPAPASQQPSGGAHAHCRPAGVRQLFCQQNMSTQLLREPAVHGAAAGTAAVPAPVGSAVCVPVLLGMTACAASLRHVAAPEARAGTPVAGPCYAASVPAAPLDCPPGGRQTA